MEHDVLSLKLPPEAMVVELDGRHSSGIRSKEREKIINEATTIIYMWPKNTGLELAGHKIEAILIQLKKYGETHSKYRQPHEIIFKQSIKQLGITINESSR